jgi:SAM-dependent methyltransferase
MLMRDRIEILPVTLLESEKSTIAELEALAADLKLEFGWHYLLDLSWIIDQLEKIGGQEFIDAGAGTGVMQWYLATKGANVISIDRESRANLAPRFRRRFHVEGFRKTDLVDGPGFSGGMIQSSFKNQLAELVDAVKFELITRKWITNPNSTGKVIIYNQDLADLTDIPDSSIDTVVAVSSLEHNSPEGLEHVVAELLMVIKPGGALIATLGAAEGEDWFHKPSRGWCYSETTLRRIFGFSNDVHSNYDQYEHLFESLRSNKELEKNLASFYFRSGDNGMPWGNWDPQYQPVGITKQKIG